MKRGRKPRYPWDAWLRPGELTLRRGADFHVQPNVMVTMVRQRSLGRFRVNADVSEDGSTVFFRMLPKHCDPFAEVLN